MGTIIITHPLAQDGTCLIIYRREGLYCVAISGPVGEEAPWRKHLDDAVYGTYAEAHARFTAEIRERTTAKETQG